MHSVAPKSFSVINQEKLKDLIFSIFSSYVEPNSKKVQVTLFELKKQIHYLCVYELKKRRWYFRDLSVALVQSLLDAVSNGYIFKKEKFSSYLEEYDQIIKDKVSGKDYDSKRLKYLKNQLRLPNINN